MKELIKQLEDLLDYCNESGDEWVKDAEALKTVIDLLKGNPCRPKSEECNNCQHCEVCRWYGYECCDFFEKGEGMTEGQTKMLLIKLWERNEATKRAEDKLMEAGLMLSDAEPMNVVFATPADMICEILSCYGLKDDEPFEKLVEAERANNRNILLKVVDDYGAD